MADRGEQFKPSVPTAVNVEQDSRTPITAKEVRRGSHFLPLGDEVEQQRDTDDVMEVLTKLGGQRILNQVSMWLMAGCTRCQQKSR